MIRFFIQVLGAVFSIALAFNVHAQGLLDPPVGPPMPTGKSSQEIFDQALAATAKATDAEVAARDAESAALASATAADSRIVITDLPRLISEPGSYRLAGNLTYTESDGGYAIRIDADNVTLDLGGFTLSSSAAVTGVGILVEGSNVTVRNGFIEGQTTISNIGTTWDVTSGGFLNGIGASLSGRGGRIEDMVVSGCRSTGILYSDGLVLRSQAIENGGSGISGFGIVQESIASDNAGEGISNARVVSHCFTSSNLSYGIRDCTVVSFCNSLSNGQIGIYLATRGAVSFSSAFNNGGGDIETGLNVVKNGNYQGSE